MHFLFAWRYFKAKKTTNAINIIAWISILAMMIGTAALLLVLSVFNGFESLVKSLYSSFYPDLKISPVQGKVLTLTEAQLARIRSTEGVGVLSLVAEEKALLQNGENQSVVFLKGVDGDYRLVSGVSNNIVKGDFSLGNDEHPSLVLGSEVENALGIMADRNLLPLVVYLPNKETTNALDLMQSVRSQNATTTGVFQIQKDFDNKYAITNLAFLKAMAGLGKDQCHAVEIKVTDPDQAEAVRSRLQKELGGGYNIMTRYEQNRALYTVLTSEKWVIYAVLSLILVVAAFNMIGALTMLVLEKRNDTATLYALGATPGFIQKIFLSEGLLLAGIGGSVGMLFVFLLVNAQLHFKLISLGEGSFLIDYYPVELRAGDFVLVGVTVMVIAVLASLIPARKARLYGIRNN